MQTFRPLHGHAPYSDFTRDLGTWEPSRDRHLRRRPRFDRATASTGSIVRAAASNPAIIVRRSTARSPLLVTRRRYLLRDMSPAFSTKDCEITSSSAIMLPAMMGAMMVRCVGLFALVVLTGCSAGEQPGEAAKRAAEVCQSLKQAGKTEEAAAACAVAGGLADDASAAAESVSTTLASDNAESQGWQYSNKEDKVRGGFEKFATLYSQNKVDFSSPYSGGTSLLINLQKIGLRPTEVLLRTDNGQFACSEYRNDTVLVRFDNGKAINFRCVTPADGSSDAVFLEPEKLFINKIKNASAIHIEVEFFQEGSHQFEFKNSGLKW